MMAKDNVSPLGSLEDISNACNELIKFNMDVRVNKTLHLVLKRKWWDMIASGEKREEYRMQSDYWIKRLVEGQYYGSDALDRYKPYENVCFHLGYTNTTMTFRIVCIYQGYGAPEWGGGKERVFIISLGERIE